jgi:ribonucleoside-diphosphate reductase beta chain
MRAAPEETQRIFLSTQIADEARHVQFFDRFFGEVGVLEGDPELKQKLEALSEHLNPAFNELFDDLLKSRVDRLGEEPEDRKALIEAVTLYHMVIEGMLALSGQHFIIDYNEREGTLPGFVEGFSNVARDEHRHIAFGVRFLMDQVNEDDGNRKVIQGMLEEAVPVADKVIDPPWATDDTYEFLGFTREETHEFAATCLSRRLKAIGLMDAAA